MSGGIYRHELGPADRCYDAALQAGSFSAEIIAHAVWLYFHFPLSLRHVEDLLAERGIEVSFQTVAEWASKFGREYARSIRRRTRGSFADNWHLDEMVVVIKGRKYWLWRAVDADGYILDALIQSRRNKQAVLKLMRKLLKGQCVTQCVTPGVMITDKLRSYDAAKKEIMPGVEHRSHKGLNNRAENSHLAVRRRERGMIRQVDTTMPAHRLHPWPDRQPFPSSSQPDEHC
jgi:putative transposase